MTQWISNCVWLLAILTIIVTILEILAHFLLSSPLLLVAFSIACLYRYMASLYDKGVGAKEHAWVYTSIRLHSTQWEEYTDRLEADILSVGCTSETIIAVLAKVRAPLQPYKANIEKLRNARATLHGKSTLKDRIKALWIVWKCWDEAVMMDRGAIDRVSHFYHGRRAANKPDSLQNFASTVRAAHRKRLGKANAKLDPEFENEDTRRVRV